MCVCLSILPHIGRCGYVSLANSSHTPSTFTTALSTPQLRCAAHASNPNTLSLCRRPRMSLWGDDEDADLFGTGTSMGTRGLLGSRGTSRGGRRGPMSESGSLLGTASLDMTMPLAPPIAGGCWRRVCALVWVCICVCLQGLCIGTRLQSWWADMIWVMPGTSVACPANVQFIVHISAYDSVPAANRGYGSTVYAAGMYLTLDVCYNYPPPSWPQVPVSCWQLLMRRLWRC